MKRGTALALQGTLITMVAAYAAYFSILSIRERAALYQFDEDLAIYDQIVWNTAHGRWFASTLIQHANNLLGDHFSPAVALFAPIYLVWPSADVLLVGQSLLLGLMAVPLYLFARKRLGAGGALLIASAYLVYPALHFVNLFQFHEIAMLPLPLAVALLGVERGSRRLFFAAALAALTVKEEVAIIVVGLGLLWWLRRRDWRTGVATIALGSVVGLITMGIILPHFSLAGHEYYYVRRYAYLGTGPLQMALTALTSPGLILAHLVTPDRLLFLAELFVPLALMPILGWEYVVAALPVFGYLLLAESPDQYAIDRHYLTPLLPFLFFGSVVGVGRVAGMISRLRARITSPSVPLPRGEGSCTEENRCSTWPAPIQRMQFLSPRGGEARREVSSASHALLALLVLVTSAAASYLIGPTPLGRGYDARAFTDSEHAGQIRRLMAEIPDDASVSASRNLLSWFSEREQVYRFPEISGADDVILDWRDLRYPAVYAQDQDALGQLFNSPDYRLIDTAGATTLFARGDPTAWSGTSDSPTNFGAELTLLGDRVRPSSDNRSVDVTLYWRALQHPSKQYTIFVHVLTTDGKTLGQGDSWPLDGLYPTDMWQPGRVVPDLHTIDLHRTVPATGVQIQVGLYDLKTGARLPITARGLPGGSDYVDIKYP